MPLRLAADRLFEGNRPCWRNPLQAAPARCPFASEPDRHAGVDPHARRPRHWWLTPCITVSAHGNNRDRTRLCKRRPVLKGAAPVEHDHASTGNIAYTATLRVPYASQRATGDQRASEYRRRLPPGGQKRTQGRVRRGRNPRRKRVSSRSVLARRQQSADGCLWRHDRGARAAAVRGGGRHRRRHRQGSGRGQALAARQFGGLSDSDTVPHFGYVIGELSRRRLAYLHLIEPRASSADDASVDSASLFRRLLDGPMITAGGYTIEMGVEAVEASRADAVAFGRMFVANPDLPERIRTGAALNTFDRSTAYGGSAHGYAILADCSTRRHWTPNSKPAMPSASLRPHMSSKSSSVAASRNSRWRLRRMRHGTSVATGGS